ncbi:MAG TPA: DUF711 family protein [Cyclobacteriaceae bacterium]|nr:DUF711 family protein [Cyclobacteriaceae bacterium]
MMKGKTVFVQLLICSLIVLLAIVQTFGQNKKLFHIRTITAGVTLTSLEDTVTIESAIQFLLEAKVEFNNKGYDVQTLRIATQPFYQYLNGKTYDEALPYLVKLDQRVKKSGMILSIGPIMKEDHPEFDIPDWAVKLINITETISFSISIADNENGILGNGVHQAASTIVAIANGTKGGEGNFRFTASANCPPGIPFFPAAYHHGKNSFAIGIESPNILTDVFRRGPEDKMKENLKLELEKVLKPIEVIGKTLSEKKNWIYDGIDTSTAPGLDSSIGEAIEELTGQPFGSSSTLYACAMITDVLKSLDVKRCGFSGLMLPVIEDKVLAQRASEGRFSVQELLLYSSVSGTGLDVVPLPGETTITTIENLLIDVAALSLKYTDKALSARLFLIPGKKAGEMVSFENPNLASCRVMKIE